MLYIIIYSAQGREKRDGEMLRMPFGFFLVWILLPWKTTCRGLAGAPSSMLLFLEVIRLVLQRHWRCDRSKDPRQKELLPWPLMTGVYQLAGEITVSESLYHTLTTTSLDRCSGRVGHRADVVGIEETGTPPEKGIQSA